MNEMDNQSDPYPDYMRASIEKVHATREARTSEVFDGLDEEQIKQILNQFHPDYIQERKKKLAFGPSKGVIVPLEVFNQLQSPSKIDPSQIDLSTVDIDVDILIIGAGGTGVSAAIWAVKSGVPADRILVATKLRVGDANTMMAQGGIQAAVKPTDSPTIHYLDVMGGGHFSNDQELAMRLTHDAPLIIKWHEEMGLMYDRNPDGTMQTIHGGGTSRKRMHFAKDYTGGEIMKTLRDELVNLGIPTLEFHPALEILKDDKGHAGGALLYSLDSKTYKVVRAKATIIGTGGFGRLHIQDFPTTNHYGATFDGGVMAHRAGVEVLNLDSVQYHPTGAAFPEQIVGLLITEKVRGSGAQVVNKDGNQFCYPLEPRDIEASLLIRECNERNLGIETPSGMKGVWLDSPLIDHLHGEGTIAKVLPAMVRQFARFGIDMTKDPILTYPTLHFQNGGVKINSNGETSVANLYAGGEVTGGAHGRNRLMGNSLLEISVFGRATGIHAASKVKKTKIGKLTLDHVASFNEASATAGIASKIKTPILFPDYRTEDTLKRLIDVF